MAADHWEYEVTWTFGQFGDKDEATKVRAMLAEMSERGWELVSGSTPVIPVTSGHGMGATIYLRHVTYWRRRQENGRGKSE
jgi:hypothetical protein